MRYWIFNSIQLKLTKRVKTTKNNSYILLFRSRRRSTSSGPTPGARPTSSSATFRQSPTEQPFVGPNPLSVFTWYRGFDVIALFPRFQDGCGLTYLRSFVRQESAACVLSSLARPFLTMGTGSSAARQQWTTAEESGCDNRAASGEAQSTNSDLPPGKVKGLSKLLEAKNKFMKNRERTPACFNKQVRLYRYKRDWTSAHFENIPRSSMITRRLQSMKQMIDGNRY